MLASELYALLHHKRCSGPFQCHWCAAPCMPKFVHDEDPPIPFEKSKSFAMRPGVPWICNGCRLFRRRSMSVTPLGGGKLIDRQSPPNHSWLITPVQDRIIRFAEHQALRIVLRSPPRQFLLALRVADPVRLQHCIVNDHESVLVSTPIRFTVDNVPLTYSVAELESAIGNGANGTEPGTQWLIKHLGPWEPKPIPTPPATPTPEPPKGNRRKLEDGRILKKQVG